MFCVRDIRKGVGMSETSTDLNQEVAALRAEVAELRGRLRRFQRTQSIRKRSKATIFGLPLYEIALGPDPESGEARGNAKAIIAIGDIATGVLALGGFAQGGLAIGGMALGLFSLGGCSVGLVAAVGGLAVGSIAVGGCAIGLVAIGGAAIGQYTAGAEGVSPELTEAFNTMKMLWRMR